VDITNGIACHFLLNKAPRSMPEYWTRYVSCPFFAHLILHPYIVLLGYHMSFKPKNFHLDGVFTFVEVFIFFTIYFFLKLLQVLMLQKIQNNFSYCFFKQVIIILLCYHCPSKKIWIQQLTVKMSQTTWTLWRTCLMNVSLWISNSWSLKNYYQRKVERDFYLIKLWLFICAIF
jgi:hypothetical protein